MLSKKDDGHSWAVRLPLDGCCPYPELVSFFAVCGQGCPSWTPLPAGMLASPAWSQGNVYPC